MVKKARKTLCAICLGTIGLRRVAIGKVLGQPACKACIKFYRDSK